MKGVTNITLQEIDSSILRVILLDMLEDAGEARAKLHRLRCHCPVGGHIGSGGVIAQRSKEQDTTRRGNYRVTDQPVLPIGLGDAHETRNPKVPAKEQDSHLQSKQKTKAVGNAVCKLHTAEGRGSWVLGGCMRTLADCGLDGIKGPRISDGG